MAEEKKYGYHPNGCIYAANEARAELFEKIMGRKLEKHPLIKTDNPCREQILEEGKLESFTKGEDKI